MAISVVVTDVGAQFIVDKLRGSNTDSPQYIASGTGSTAAAKSDTDLGAEVETRVSATLSSPTSKQFQAKATQTFGSDHTSPKIYEAGLWTKATDGTAGEVLVMRGVDSDGDSITAGDKIEHTFLFALSN